MSGYEPSPIDVSLTLLLDRPILGPYYARRVRDSFAGRLFGTPEYPHLAAADIDLCTKVDRFDFCLLVEREDNFLVMRPARV